MYTDYPWEHGYRRMRLGKKGVLESISPSLVLLQKGSSFTQEMSTIVLRIHALGFKEYYEKMRLPLAAEQFDNFEEQEELRPFTLSDLALAFFIYLILLFFAIATFGAEMLTLRGTRSQRSQRQEIQWSTGARVAWS